jgi:hypothetical protein
MLNNQMASLTPSSKLPSSPQFLAPAQVPKKTPMMMADSKIVMWMLVFTDSEKDINHAGAWNWDAGILATGRAFWLH